MGKIKGRKKNKILPKKRVQGMNFDSLEKKVKESSFVPSDNLVFAKDVREKMSEVILHFAEPILHGIEHDIEAMKKAVSFAIIVWNFSLLPIEEQNKGIDDLLRAFAGEDYIAREAGEDIVEILLERKKLYYPNNRRVVISYEFQLQNGHPMQNVASTMG